MNRPRDGGNKSRDANRSVKSTKDVLERFTFVNLIGLHSFQQIETILDIYFSKQVLPTFKKATNFCFVGRNGVLPTFN